MMSKETKNSGNVEGFEFEKITRKGTEEGIEPVAVEKSYDLNVNGARLASVMTSPSDLEELGYGYLLSEGLVESEERIKSVNIREGEIHTFVEGSERLGEFLELRSSGCVGFNWENEKEEFSIDSGFEITPEQVFQVLDYLKTEVYKKTSGTHTASIINKQGQVVAKSIDVGRHNTFDKVIGKAILQEIDLSETLLLASGRQSAGMVMKAARVGIPIIITKAAPISSGIDAAKKTGLTLICFADENKFLIFTGKERIRI